MTNVILSHIDADGVLSAALAQKVWGGKVIFQKWHKFGVDEEDAALMLSYKPKMVIVTDLGAEERTLENLRGVADTGVKVYLFDNHPPEDLSSLTSYATENFNIASSGINCSAGLLYDYVKEIVEDKDLPWFKAWAAIAIYADVKHEAEQGKPMIEEILKENPILKAKILRWGKGEDGRFSTQEGEMLSTLATYFNTPRRIARHYGAYTSFAMVKEIEKANDLTLPEQDFSPREQALYPATYTIKRWKEEWYSRWSDVFKADNIRYWDFGAFTFSVINHEWNLGTQVANIKARDRERPKPHFCLNLYPFDGYVTIGARRPDSSKLDVGKTLNKVTELSGGKISGGGLAMAASAHALAGITVSEVINHLVAAVRMVE